MTLSNTIGRRMPLNRLWQMGLALLLALVVVAALAPSRAAAYTYTSVSVHAGAYGGTTGAVTDGTGTSATFAYPAWLAIDSGGDLWVSDSNSAIMRTVDDSGVVSTVAGKDVNNGGGFGHVDDNGADARLGVVSGITFSGGDLWSFDMNPYTGDMALRTIDSAFDVDTQQALGSWSGGAYGLSRDASTGDSFFMKVDYANGNSLQKVTSGGTATTLAATAGPGDTVLDGAGNLIFADAANHVIKSVDLSTGTVSTVAGLSGTSGATDASGTSARFNLPYGIALDPNGDLIVADTMNARIRHVDMGTGAVTTIAGLGTSAAPGTFSFPTDVAVNGDGDIFITDIGTKQISVMRAS